MCARALSRPTACWSGVWGLDFGLFNANLLMDVSNLVEQDLDDLDLVVTDRPVQSRLAILRKRKIRDPQKHPTRHNTLHQGEQPRSRVKQPPAAAHSNATRAGDCKGVDQSRQRECVNGKGGGRGGGGEGLVLRCNLWFLADSFAMCAIQLPTRKCFAFIWDFGVHDSTRSKRGPSCVIYERVGTSACDQR